MIYIYDILLNFNKKLYDYYEWNRSDNIVHIKRIKLFKVSTIQMEELCLYDISLDKEFLDNIHDTTELYRKDGIEYACLFTDGYRAVGIIFNSLGKSILKSKLLLEEEEEVLGISERLKEINISFKKRNKANISYLTRKEQKEKELLEKKIKYLYQNKRVEILKYLYLQYYGVCEDNIDNIYKELINSLDDYNLEHTKLLEVIEISQKKQV